MKKIENKWNRGRKKINESQFLFIFCQFFTISFKCYTYNDYRLRIDDNLYLKSNHGSFKKKKIVRKSAVHFDRPDCD